MDMWTVIANAIVIAVICFPLYLGWRMVRALESRKATRSDLAILNTQIENLERERHLLTEQVNTFTEQQAHTELLLAARLQQGAAASPPAEPTS